MNTLEVKGVDLPAQIAQQVRRLINRGVLAPGLQLRQSDLADQFGISRVPVREALKLLAAEGIIEHDPNRGFFVAPLSTDEAQQFYRYRFLLERELLKTVNWPDSAQMKALKSMLERLDTYLDKGQRAEWIDEYQNFYALLFDLSPEKILRREAIRLIRLTDRYRALASEVRMPGEHLTARLEHTLLSAMSKKDRGQLIHGFERERDKILTSMLATIGAREL
ncbi:GntR family transcriptional regulator [Cupriavidus necator]|uniref:GntR family transcriptional regulator n=1 Tax=Cupriavidus necator TaxID=106590 RepID=UPI0039C3266A